MEEVCDALDPCFAASLPRRRDDYDPAEFCRQARSAGAISEQFSIQQQTSKQGSPPEDNVAAVTRLLGSPMPTSLLDPSGVHLNLSPNQGITHSGAFSPSPFHTLLQSPCGATLDDSPYQGLSHPPAKHSPVSAAAQHTAAQASRQAAVGHAHGQRYEQQSTTRAMNASEHASTAMLVPVPAPPPIEDKSQVTQLIAFKQGCS